MCLILTASFILKCIAQHNFGKKNAHYLFQASVEIAMLALDKWCIPIIFKIEESQFANCKILKCQNLQGVHVNPTMPEMKARNSTTASGRTSTSFYTIGCRSEGFRARCDLS